jgi:hypothetical protein
MAYYDDHGDSYGDKGYGATPEESVVRLLLALNTKTQ